MSPSTLLVGALLLGAAHAQFLQPLVASPDPALALQPPPLQQAHFASFAQPVQAAPAQIFQQAPQPLPLQRQMLLQQQQQQQQVALQQNTLPQQTLAHHAVVRTLEDEARLPAELRNNFYKNPRIAEGLAKESWFIPGEEQVLEREAEKIPRAQIFKLLKNAGLARRR